MSERYLVHADADSPYAKKGSLQVVQLDEDGGQSWREIEAPEWEALQARGYQPANYAELTRRLEGEAQGVRDDWARRAQMRVQQEALVEALKSRGFLPEEMQGAPRLRRTGQQTEEGKDLFDAYVLDMRGTEHKGPVSLEEANYLYNLDPERAEVVGPEEDVVPLPLPQPAPEQTKRRAAAMLQALRGGG